MLVMSRLMSKYNSNFVGSKFFKQSVAENYPFTFTKSSEPGICFFCILTHIETEYSGNFNIHICKYFIKFLFYFAIFQLCEFIKQGEDYNRSNSGKKNRYYKDKAREVQPPFIPHASNKKVKHKRHGNSYDYAQGSGL